MLVKVYNKKKVIDKERVSRLEAEVEALTNLQHPFVVRTLKRQGFNNRLA